MQFVERLIAENKQFDLMLYPNRNHGIKGGNTSRHLYTLLADYFLENL
jgi:dipeptidyl-peptidase-4